MSRAFFISLFVSCAVSVMSKACTGTATYSLSFQGEWTANGRPPDAHFSGLVGCSHNHCYQMFKTGEKASIGVKNVAESGDSTVLRQEAAKLHVNKTTFDCFYGPNDIPASGITNFPQQTFQVDALRPWVSVIVKISPSPDWFVGKVNIDLCDRTSGEWLLEKKTLPFKPYDAGTKSGSQFSTDGTGSTNHNDISSRSAPLTTWLKQEDGLGLFSFSRQHQTVPPVGNTENDQTFQCPNVASRTAWSGLLFICLLMLLC